MVAEVSGNGSGSYTWWYVTHRGVGFSSPDIYHQIPLFAIFKLWSSVISPYLPGRSSTPEDAQTDHQPTSKRQEKLRKRSEKGDPRVRMQNRK